MSDSNSTARFCQKCQAETERQASGHCKACMKARRNAWNAANPDRVKAYGVAYRAANPSKLKAYAVAWAAANSEKINAAASAWYADNHEKARATQAAYRAANIEKINAQKAVYRAANPAKLSAESAAWRKANPEACRILKQNRRARERENGGTLSRGLAAKLFKLQRGKCACCGQPLGDNFHLDHIMPIDLGGSNMDDNIQLLRQRCNNQKHNKHPVDFMQERGFLL